MKNNDNLYIQEEPWEVNIEEWARVYLQKGNPSSQQITSYKLSP